MDLTLYNKQDEEPTDKQAQKWDISYFFTAKKQTKNKLKKVNNRVPLNVPSPNPPTSLLSFFRLVTRPLPPWLL